MGLLDQEHHDDLLDTENQCEELRRFVDDWGAMARELTDTLCDAAAGVAADEPVCLVGAPNEELRLEDLAVTINPAFSKLIVIFAHLTTEIARLHRAAEETLFPTLVVFGERPHLGDDTLFEGDLQAALARALTQLQDVVLFLEQLTAVSRNLFSQLSALYGNIQRIYAPLQAVRLVTAFKALGSALGLAAGLDEAVNTNVSLPSAFAMFKRMLSTVRNDPVRFNDVIAAAVTGAAGGAPGGGEGATAAAAVVDQLEAALVILENRLLSADCLGDILDTFAAEGPHPQNFLDELASAAHAILTDVSSRLFTESERPSDRRTLLGAYSLVALHSRLTPQSLDKKLVKAAWDLSTQKQKLKQQHPHQQQRGGGGVGVVLSLPASSTVLLQPVEFLCSYLPTSAVALGPKEPLRVAAANKEDALDRLDADVMKEIAGLLAQGTAWIVRFESSLPTKCGVNMSAVLGPRVRLLSNGLFIAQRLRTLLQSAIHLCVSLDAPMSKAELRVLAQTAELLQAILSAYNRRKSELVLEAPHLLSFALGRLAGLVAPAKFVLEEAMASVSTGWSRLQSTLAGRGGAGADAARQDAVAAASLAERVLSGPPTANRLNLIRFCFDTLNDAYVLQDGTGEDAAELIELTDLIANIEWHADVACDTSFLFFSRELFPACLADIYSRPDEAHRLPALVAAFRASQKILLRGGGGGGGGTVATPELLEGCEAEMQLALEDEIIRPLCTDVETDLRLHIHSARLTGVVDVNPVQSGVKDLSQFLRIAPIRLLTRQIDLRGRVVHYLNAAFHNHTAVSLHNWKTYGEMRNLAMEKYNIPLAEIELPGQTLEQGLDVLEIMRNIHIFVARYNYNLNTQCFIEKSLNAKDRKHLNTISIRHVANSIRTHGTGITHTTINFVYQYLAQRFQVFSQFLYDDHIKSMLIKELRALTGSGVSSPSPSSATTTMGNKMSGGGGGGLGRFRAAVRKASMSPTAVTTETHHHHAAVREKQQYPVDRAMRLIRAVRQLGVTESGLSFLDQFRLLITEIGNALGFVRQVRMGQQHHSTAAARFIPPSSSSSSSQRQQQQQQQQQQQGTATGADLENMARADGLSDTVAVAAKLLDNELESLKESSTDGTDFFQTLVAVFSELRSESQTHLSNFYLSLPALMLSFAESLMHQKEKLTRRGRDRGLFTRHRTFLFLSLNLCICLTTNDHHNIK